MVGARTRRLIAHAEGQAFLGIAAGSAERDAGAVRGLRVDAERDGDVRLNRVERGEESGIAPRSDDCFRRYLDKTAVPDEQRTRVG